MQLRKHHYFYIFIFFLFIGIISKNLFSDGMFLDGLLYAVVSKNMSQGIGSFWSPHLTSCFFSEFYEHPPLAFGIQSLVFKLFGESIFIERFYSLFTYIIVGYIMVLIWEHLTRDKKTGWIPILFWICIDNVIWAVSNNMLENTMSIFVCLSVLFYLYSFNKKRSAFLVLFSGISIFLGVLTKGFFCLYIWSLPFFMWFFRREKTFLKMVLNTSILVFGTVFPIIFLYFFSNDANNAMQNYFSKQVVKSIMEVNRVDNRFYIIIRFLENITIPIFVTLIVFYISIKDKINKNLYFKNIKTFLVFLSVVLSGVLPIMISMKQSGFYILTVYPLLAIGVAYLVYPVLKILIKNIEINSFKFNIFKWATFLVFIISIIISISQKNNIGRDIQTIRDCKIIIKIVGKNKTINICKNMHFDWTLHGYFARYGNISLDKNENNSNEYYLALDNCNKKYLNKNYEKIKIKLEKYTLYMRK